MGSRYVAAAVGAGVLLVSTGILAEPAGNAVPAADAAGLEEIVVTAERREESVQNVGIAISVLSGDTLAAKSITIVNDLQNAVPS